MIHSINYESKMTSVVWQRNKDYLIIQIIMSNLVFENDKILICKTVFILTFKHLDSKMGFFKITTRYILCEMVYSFILEGAKFNFRLTWSVLINDVHCWRYWSVSEDEKVHCSGYCEDENVINAILDGL